MFFSNQQKGISLLLIVVIAAVILSIGLGISAILLSQLKLMRNLGDSVIAFYAADSGMEAQLYNFYHDRNSTSSQITLSNNASYDVVATCSQRLYALSSCYDIFQNQLSGDPNCQSDYCIKSVGSFRETRRALKAAIGSE